MAPASALALDGALAALERGREQGYHRGAQLSVRLAGHEAIDLAIGDVRVDALLPWFSCTKAITSLAVAQVWERGLVDLDDAVATHVPEFAQGGKERVTLRHVLTHTGGFRVASGDLWRLDWDDAVAAVCAVPMPPDWVPGERAAYDPVSGYQILGEVVRRVDGRAFDAYVNEEIFEPLDMADAWLSLSAERFTSYKEAGRIAQMYDTTKKAEPRPLPGYDDGRAFRRVAPGGSGIGPMRDLVRFAQCLLGKGEVDGQRVASPQTIEAMMARHRVNLLDETFGMVIDWGLGLLINSFHYRSRPTSYGLGKHASRRAAGHGGSQSSMVFCDPEKGLAVAIACNGMPGEPGHHRRMQPVLTALYEDLDL